MKKTKLSLLNRIFVLFCSLFLLTSSIFLSYSTVVYADYDDFDFGVSVANVSLIILGLLETGFSGGTLTPVAAGQIIVALTSEGKHIYDYLSDNGDGTYTINEEFIQAVMDAAEKLEAQGFTDKDIIKQKNERYQFHYVVTSSQNYHNNVYGCMYEGVIDMNGRAACMVSPYDFYPGSFLFSKFYAIKSSHIVEYERIKFNDGYTRDLGNAMIFGETYGANVPIFSDADSLNDYLANGTGYKDALNYREKPIFRRHSAYTPTYSGGSVRVTRNVIDNINSKIAEVDSDDSLTDDQKIEILQQYILTGETGGTGGTGGSGSGDKDSDYDDNKDLLPGTDLIDTNSWLKKIYLKVCQIYDKMSLAVENFKKFFIFEDAPGINMRYITSLFERMLEQLRGISDDLGDIKGQLADMSEQEFSKQTESFLDDTMDSFMEITEKAKGKFPFSIPNDIRLLISKMSVSHQEESGPGTYKVMTMAYDDDVGNSGLISVMDESGGDVPIISETGAPIFYLPFVIASAGIEQYVLIDLSGFEPISSFCRSLMTVWFLLCLYNLTFKVMGLWGDLVD